MAAPDLRAPAHAEARTPEAPVVVVGLGPVGATLAILLAQAGVPVVVLERDETLHALPRAAHLDADALRVLAAAGVALTGRAIDGFRLVDARLKLLLHARRCVGVETGQPDALLIHQPTVEQALRARLGELPGVEIRAGHGVHGLGGDADGATVRGTAKGEPFEMRASFVVGCDGARSRVREAVGARLGGGRFEQPWLVVDTMLLRDVPLPDALLQIADPERPATFVPFPGRRRRWEFRLLPGETEARMTRPDTLRSLLSRYVDPDAVEVERAAVYTFHDLVATPWRRGRLVAIGDAVHQMPPFLGQGIGAGVQDAATLAWMLALVWHGQASPDLLDALEAERRPHVEAVTRLAVRLGRLVSAGGTEARVRDVALRLGARLGAASGGFSAPFPAVRPVLGHPPRRARVPNAWLLRQGARLDDVAGGAFLVVGIGCEPFAGDAVARLGAGCVRVEPETCGSLWAWAGRRRCVVVVRPDRLALGVYDPAEAMRASADLRAMLA